MNSFRYFCVFLFTVIVLGSCENNNIELDNLDSNKTTYQNAENDISDEDIEKAVEEINEIYNVNLSKANFYIENFYEFENTPIESIIFKKGNTTFAANTINTENDFAFFAKIELINKTKVNVNLYTSDKYSSKGSNNEISFHYTTNNLPYQTKESCIGNHYRVMKEIINSDGDTKILCDILNWLGNLCDIEVMTASVIACLLGY